MFAVVFEVNPRTERWDDYLSHAAELRPELLKIDGFLTNDRYSSLTRPGWLVSLSIWRDEKALIRWRTHALHHDIQGKGRNAVFADYHLRVGEIVADTQPDPAQVLVQQRFDVTDVGAGKAISLMESSISGPHVQDPVADQPGLVERDCYASITRPGDRLEVTSWVDVAAAAAALAIPGRHRILRVIRDYGMFNRVEAPQFYPPPGRYKPDPDGTA